MIVGHRHRLNAEINRQGRLAEEIARAQMEISGKVKILAPSDDPAGAARVGQIKRSQSNEAIWLANAEAASALADRADTSLDSLVALGTRAIELMTAGRSGTVSAESREAYALELEGIAESIRAIQTQIDPRGQRVFPTNDPLEIPVGPSLTISATLPNDAVFGVGTDDFATILDEAAASLRIADQATREATTATSLTRVSAASSRAIDAQSAQGSRMSLIDSIKDRFAESKLTLESERSDIEDTDITEAVAKLNAQLLALEASQASFVRINKQSLFSLLG